jgi:arylsulfatase A-like enzyme
MPKYDGERIDPPYTHWQDVPGLTEEKVTKAHACYCGEITMVDTWIGRFLRQLENMGLMEKTAIIFTTDHGFYFGEHDGLFGKTFGFGKTKEKVSPRYQDKEENWLWGRSPLFEETVACPLMIYLPDTEPGIYDGLTSAVDLMPTVLDILRKEVPDTVEGQSLLPMMKSPALNGREYVVSTQPFSKPGFITRQVDGRERKMTVGSSTTITTDEWALLYSTEPGESWLYHLPSDPKQEQNVVGRHPDIAKDLHRYLVRFMQDYKLPAELREPRMALQL